MPHPSLILMYHRVAEISCDPWGLAVSPQTLSRQLEILRRERSVVPLSWLAKRLRHGERADDAVALTFDDGYSDVLSNGKQILEAQNCPATLFLATGAIGSEKGYWWDVLSRIILETTSLPSALTLELAFQSHRWRSVDPMSDGLVSASARSELHLALWRLLKPLAPRARWQALDDLARWAGTDAQPRASDRTLTYDECRRLYHRGVIDLGAHSVSHPSLPDLSPEDRSVELKESREALKHLADGAVIEGFSYPFGDFDDDCVSAVAAAGFDYACTTVAGVVSGNSNPLLLSRITVGNWPDSVFEERILAYS